MLVTPYYVVLNLCFNIIHFHQKKPMNDMVLKPDQFEILKKKKVQILEVELRMDRDDVIMNQQLNKI